MGEPAPGRPGRAATAAVTTSPSLDASGLLEAALVADPDLPRSSLTGTDHLVVHLGPPASMPPAQRAVLGRWLRRQACPVLGVAAAGDGHPLACACDLVVEQEADLEPVLAEVRHNPLTAMVLVQLLRVTETLDIERALLCESLAYSTLQGGAEYQRWLQATPRPAPAALAEEGAAVLIERRGPRLQLRLNRPQRRNALSIPMRDALAEALGLVCTDTTIREVIISGAGSCFSAGGDLAEFGSAPDLATAHAVRSARSIPALLARCASRVTFRIHGAAIGAGAELAAFGGRVEATADAFFQLPEIRYGLIPGSGGCVSLPRRIGRHRTALLALSGMRLLAPLAHRWGLIDVLYGDRATTPADPEAGTADGARRLKL